MSIDWRTVGKTLSRHDEPEDDGTCCSHLHLIHDVAPSSTACEECVALGDTWLHLRKCLVCGHVGCCDNSKNTHARKHYHATGHPLMQPFDEPWEAWAWCYEDEVYLRPRDDNDQ